MRSDILGKNRTGARLVIAAALLPACVMLASCGKHYRVTDPASGAAYYTKDVDKLRGGAVRFKDADTGAKVTLQDSKVERIKKREYKDGVRGE